VVTRIGEHGEQEEWGGDTYTCLRGGDHKYRTTGAKLMIAVILNRKPWGQDRGDREKGTAMLATAPASPSLFDGTKESS